MHDIVNSDERPLEIPVLGLRASPGQYWRQDAITPTSISPEVDPFGVSMGSELGELPPLSSSMRYDATLQISVPGVEIEDDPNVRLGPPPPPSPPPPPPATSCGWLEQTVWKGGRPTLEPIWVEYRP